MPKAVASEMIEAHLHHQLRFQWLPFPRTFRAPAARTSGGSTGKSGRLTKRLKFWQKPLSLLGAQPRTESNKVQQPCLVIESKQKRTDDLFLRCVTKAAHHAIGGASQFNFFHARSLARCIRKIEPFRDDPVQVTAHRLEPFFCHAKVCRSRRKAQPVRSGTEC